MVNIADLLYVSSTPGRGPTSIGPHHCTDCQSVLATVGRLASLWPLVPDGLGFIAKVVPSIIFAVAPVGSLLEVALARGRRSAVGQRQPGGLGGKNLLTRKLLHGRATFARGDNRYGSEL